MHAISLPARALSTLAKDDSACRTISRYVSAAPASSSSVTPAARNMRLPISTAASYGVQTDAGPHDGSLKACCQPTCRPEAGAGWGAEASQPGCSPVMAFRTLASSVANSSITEVSGGFGGRGAAMASNTFSRRPALLQYCAEAKHGLRLELRDPRFVQVQH